MATQSKRKKTKKSNFWASDAGKKTFVVLLGLIGLAGLIVIINGFNSRSPGANSGVGADGFSVYQMPGADLGIVNVVKKPVVVSEFGDLVKQVDEVDKSGVVNYNGSKGQTATYYLVTKHDTQGSFYVDVMEYPTQKAYDEADVFNNTADAGKVQNLPARYMKAITIANEREYALLVSKGTKSYKFAFTQPFNKIKFDETTIQAILKRIAEKAQM